MNVDLTRDIWDWLQETLLTLPTGAWRRPEKIAQVNVIKICAAGLSFHTAPSTVLPFDVKQISEELLHADRKAPVILRMESDCFLRRNLSSSRLPFTRTTDLVSLELAEHMPFLQTQVHVLFGASREGTGTDYFVIKKEVIEPILAALRASGHRIDGILLSESGRVDPATKASVRALVRHSARWSWRSRVLAILSALVISGTVATFGHAYLRTADANARLTVSVDDKRLEALVIRKKVDALQREMQLLQAARAAKIKAVPASALWEELTRILPDSTWLTDLTVHEDTVSVTGFSRSAADLIAIIGASQSLQEPRFTTPVMRVPGQEGERFTIQMKVARQ